VTTPAPEKPVGANARPEIEFVILAERVEILNGKLYMMGGGYDRLVLERPPPQTMSVTFAVGLLMPWEASGREHHLQFAVLDEAGNTVAASDRLILNINRPAGLGEGDSQRVMLAPLGGPVTFPSYGRFFLRVVLDGAVQKTVMFSVVDRERGLNA
jgi:hypothetical protein